MKILMFIIGAIMIVSLKISPHKSDIFNFLSGVVWISAATILMVFAVKK